jgi:hypothetical protein
MDVLNRKLFANKEARNKLAEMGGIMASSEALMREAQNVPMYAPGGVVDAPQRQPQFVITIPGYRNGAMFRINESTLMMMNDTIPDLMSQEGTQVFPVEMFGDSDAALKIRPGDAIINADLNPRQEQVALPEQTVTRKQTVLERKGLESMFGGPDLSNYTGERTTFSDVMTNPAYDASLDNTQAIVPETPFAPTESYVPPERQKGPAFSAFGMPTPADYQTTFPISSQDIYTDNLAKEQNSTKKRVEQIDSGISAIETELAKDPFNADIKRRLEEAKRQRDAAVKAQQEAITAPEVAPVEGPQDSGTPLFAQEEFSADNLVPPSNTRPGPSTTDTDTGLSFGADVPAMQNPGAWGEGIALTFGKTGNPGDATGVALSGLGVKPAEDLKSRNKQMQDLFKEMFGDSDEDVAKEKYLNLAMIGFAIASGASGNALTNISQGMMQGVSKMLEDQKDRKGRDEKLKYAAFNMASDAQIRADDRATALIDAETTRKNSFKDALNLYSLKKDRDDESKTFLDTDKGKGMQKLFESLNTASGSPAAALTQMSTAYSPEDMKRWQSASGILGTPAALSEEQKANQALFNKYNKP